jgi:ADP-ribose pyrophosphatase YjhB (NUDIX family)
MARKDYYHDPDAPKANSLVPSTTAAVRDDQGCILLIHKIDNDYWALPGGGMELGESIVELTGLVGIYTDPGHVMAYDDGEVRQEFSVCFHARVLSGQPREDGSETKEVRWVEPADVPGLSIHPSMRRRIDDALAGDSTPQIV